MVHMATDRLKFAAVSIYMSIDMIHFTMDTFEKVFFIINGDYLTCVSLKRLHLTRN